MDSIELGGRLRVARETRSLSQQAAAAAIEVPRTYLTLLESGERAVSTLELSRLARLYRRPISFFFGEVASTEEDAPAALHRVAPNLEKDPEIRDQVERHLDLCRDGVVLETLLGRPPRSGPPAHDLRPPRAVDEAVVQGGRVAREERRRLGIGNLPIPDMSGLIGSQGIWAFSLALPEHMSGLFVRHPSIRLAVIVNASHPRERKRFSYAREYAHALMDGERDVTVSSAADSKDLVEARANAFAASFLVPGDGVHEVLESLDKRPPGRREQMISDAAASGRVEADSHSAPRFQRITCIDVAYVAHRFGVSYRIALRRLEDLGHVSKPESSRLLEHKDSGMRHFKELDMLDGVEGEEQRQRWDHGLRCAIIHLAVEAYRREEVSRGRLLELGRNLNMSEEALLEPAKATRR